MDSNDYWMTSGNTTNTWVYTTSDNTKWVSSYHNTSGTVIPHPSTTGGYAGGGGGGHINVSIDEMQYPLIINGKIVPLEDLLGQLFIDEDRNLCLFVNNEVIKIADLSTGEEFQSLFNVIAKILLNK